MPVDTSRAVFTKIATNAMKNLAGNMQKGLQT